MLFKYSNADDVIRNIADLIFNSENCPAITKEDMLVDLKRIIDKYNKSFDKNISYK